MRKSVLFLALLISVNPFSAIAQTNEEDGEYYQDDGDEGYWYGPGWYWGIYIDNENDYWRHHNQRYGNNGHRGGSNSGGHSGHGGGGGGHGGGGH